MTLQIVPLNYVAVVVAAIASMVIGFLYYSPSLFGGKWMKLAGITKKEADKAMKQGMAKTLVLGFITALVMAWVIAMIIGNVGAATVTEGAMVGFWAWLGFVATFSYHGVLWGKQPHSLGTLQNGNNLISMVVIGAIIAAL